MAGVASASLFVVGTAAIFHIFIFRITICKWFAIFSVLIETKEAVQIMFFHLKSRYNVNNG